MYSRRRASNKGLQVQLETNNMKYMLLNGGGGGGGGTTTTQCSWLGSNMPQNVMENKRSAWGPPVRCKKLNFVPATCNDIVPRGPCMQKQQLQGCQLRPQCPKGSPAYCRTVTSPLKSGLETPPPLRVTGMFPTVVGLCCRVHAMSSTPGSPKPTALAAAVSSMATPRTYASAVKRPEGTITAPVKVPERLKNDPVRDTKLQKLTAATIRLASGQGDQKPVVAPSIALLNGRKCRKFSELKEMLSSSNSSPISSQIPGSATSGTRRNSIDYAVTCVVGTTLTSPKRPEFKGISSPAEGSVPNNKQNLCNNPHIAFIMGVVCEDDDFEDDWDSDSDFESDGTIIVTQSDQRDLHSKDNNSYNSDPSIVKGLPPDHSQPEVNSAAIITPLIEANRKWMEAYGGSNVLVDSPSTASKKVSFVEDDGLVTVHDIGESYDRKGPWEEFARDRCRFKRRIEELSLVIVPVLDPDHRRKIYEQRVAPSLYTMTHTNN